MDAQDATRLITIHQLHSSSHMNVHCDSSLCSILGVYPLRCLDSAAALADGRPGDYKVMGRNELPYENGYEFDES